MLLLAFVGLWASLCLSFAVACGIIGMPASEIFDLIYDVSMPVALPIVALTAMSDLLKIPSGRVHE